MESHFNTIIVKRFFILTFCLFVICSSSFAQDPFSIYASSYYDRDYIIEISFTKKSTYLLHIEVASLDDRCYFAGLRISEKAVGQVVANLREAKERYKELRSNAQRNRINYLSQQLKIDGKVVGAYFKQRGKEYIDHSVKPKFSFEVERKNGQTIYLLKMKTGRMISPIFEHIQCSGAEIVFSSEAEIDELIDVLSL